MSLWSLVRAVKGRKNDTENQNKMERDMSLRC